MLMWWFWRCIEIMPQPACIPLHLGLFDPLRTQGVQVLMGKDTKPAGSARVLWFHILTSLIKLGEKWAAWASMQAYADSEPIGIQAICLSPYFRILAKQQLGYWDHVVQTSVVFDNIEYPRRCKRPKF